MLTRIIIAALLPFDAPTTPDVDPIGKRRAGSLFSWRNKKCEGRSFSKYYSFLQRIREFVRETEQTIETANNYGPSSAHGSAAESVLVRFPEQSLRAGSPDKIVVDNYC